MVFFFKDYRNAVTITIISFSGRLYGSGMFCDTHGRERKKEIKKSPLL